MASARKTGGALSASQERTLEILLRGAHSGDAKFARILGLLYQVGFAPVAQADADRALVTARVLASGFGVSRRQVDRWRKQGMPQFRAAASNRPALYDVFDVLRWKEAREAAERAATPEGMLAGEGGDSAALEAYRWEQYRRVKRENDLAEGHLLPSADVAAHDERFVAFIRSGLERLREECGTAPYEVMAGVLADIQRELDEFTQHAGGGETCRKEGEAKGQSGKAGGKVRRRRKPKAKRSGKGARKRKAKRKTTSKK